MVLCRKRFLRAERMVKVLGSCSCSGKRIQCERRLWFRLMVLAKQASYVRAMVLAQASVTTLPSGCSCQASVTYVPSGG